MCKDTSSGIDQSGHVAKRCENLAHAALCSPSLIVQMQGFHFEGRLHGIKKRTRGRSHLEALPNLGSYPSRCECTIVPPSPWERKGTISTSGFLVTCLVLPSTNTVPRMLENDGRDLRFLVQRRFVPEPWQWCEDGVHSQKSWKVLKRLMALRTHPRR